MSTIEPGNGDTCTVDVGGENETINDHIMKALLSWSVNRLKEHLKGNKLPYSGNKTVLAKRISSSLEKEDAIEIVKEFEEKNARCKCKKEKDIK